jgi:hypothetical protein
LISYNLHIRKPVQWQYLIWIFHPCRQTNMDQLHTPHILYFVTTLHCPIAHPNHKLCAFTLLLTSANPKTSRSSRSATTLKEQVRLPGWRVEGGSAVPLLSTSLQQQWCRAGADMDLGKEEQSSERQWVVDVEAPAPHYSPVCHPAACFPATALRTSASSQHGPAMVGDASKALLII